VDVSGSMVGNPIKVAISLGMYMAEHATGPYANHFITFSESPELQEIIGSTIVEKINNMSHAAWDMNTDLVKVFDLILNTAKKHNLSNDEIIKKLYIISDMQFDQATERSDEYFFEVIKSNFNDNGYDMPQLVFWNVKAANNHSMPMTTDSRGFLNVSGFSPSIFESLMNNKIISAMDLMLEVINNPRYNPITIRRDI